MTATSPNPHLSDRSQVLFAYPLTLATRGAIQVYNRTFRRADAALYLAQIIVRMQGAASRQFTAEITQVNTAVDDELRRLEDTLATQRGWMSKRLAAASTADADAEGVIYTEPATATLGLRTPKARRYVCALAALDQALQHLDRAWYDGRIADDERLTHIARLARGFDRACGVIERLARGLAQRVRAEEGAAPLNATYQAMLVKRTGRGAGEAPPPPLDIDPDRPMMTLDEVANLQAMEDLATALTTPTSTAEPAEPAMSEAFTTPVDVTPELPALAERAPSEEPTSATDTASEALTAPTDAPPEEPVVVTDTAPEGLTTLADALPEEPTGATDTAPEALTAPTDVTPEATPEALDAAEAATLLPIPAGGALFDPVTETGGEFNDPLVDAQKPSPRPRKRLHDALNRGVIV